MAVKFIKLTNLAGGIVLINIEAIAMLREPIEGERGHSAIMFTSGNTHWFKELVAEIETRISVDAQVADKTSHR